MDTTRLNWMFSLVDFAYETGVDSEEITFYTFKEKSSRTWLETSVANLLPKPRPNSIAYGQKFYYL